MDRLAPISAGEQRIARVRTMLGVKSQKLGDQNE